MGPKSKCKNLLDVNIDVKVMLPLNSQHESHRSVTLKLKLIRCKQEKWASIRIWATLDKNQIVKTKQLDQSIPKASVLVVCSQYIVVSAYPKCSRNDHWWAGEKIIGARGSLICVKGSLYITACCAWGCECQCIKPTCPGKRFQCCGSLVYCTTIMKWIF